MDKRKTRTEYLINKLKFEMGDFVSNYIEMCKQRRELETKIDYIKNILEYLDSDDVYEIFDNREFINNTIELAFDENPEQADFFKHKVNEIVYSYFNNQGIVEPYLEDEALESFHSLLDLFEEEYVDFTVDFKMLSKKTYELYPKVKDCKLIHSAFKSNKFINLYLSDKIQEFMTEQGYDDQKQILVLEGIRLHNYKTTSKREKVPESYVERMLSTNLRKFEISEEDEFDLGKSFNEGALDIAKTINHSNPEELDKALSYLPTKSAGYSIREFRYVYNVVLNHLIDLLYISVADISDLSNYTDKELKNLAIESYEDIYRKYLKVYHKYKGDLLDYPEEILSEIPMIEDLQTNTYINKLVYLNNGTVSYLERDLKKFPKEYYETIKELLEGKKLDILPSRQDTVMNSNNERLSGFGKLKQDQVRIMYKSLGDGVYLIIGGFDKRQTDDMVGYLSLSDRYKRHAINIEELLESSEELEESLYSNIEQNKRQGDR